MVLCHAPATRATMMMTMIARVATMMRADKGDSNNYDDTNDKGKGSFC